MKMYEVCICTGYTREKSLFLGNTYEILVVKGHNGCNFPSNCSEKFFCLSVCLYVCGHMYGYNQWSKTLMIWLKDIQVFFVLFLFLQALVKFEIVSK